MPHTWFVSNQQPLSSLSTSPAVDEIRIETPAASSGTKEALTGDKIRERMAMIRTHIEEHSDEVIAQTDALSDWRFYVRRYPWVAVTGAAVVGYAIVPRRRKPGEEDRTRETNKRPAAFGAAEIRSVLTGAAQRAAMAYASKMMGDVLGRFFADDGEG